LAIAAFPGTHLPGLEIPINSFGPVEVLKLSLVGRDKLHRSKLSYPAHLTCDLLSSMPEKVQKIPAYLYIVACADIAKVPMKSFALKMDLPIGRIALESLTNPKEEVFQDGLFPDQFLRPSESGSIPELLINRIKQSDSLNRKALGVSVILVKGLLLREVLFKFSKPYSGGSIRNKDSAQH